VKFLLSAVLAVAVPMAAAQALSDPPSPVESLPSAPAYVQPTQQEKVHNYLFEAFGPYPAAWTTIVAGYHQARRNPPDWREGWPGYGERYASDFGNSAVNISTRFALSQALHEDTLYYRCACSGVWPRLRHAVYWTVFAHRGADGHAAFALPTLAGPYVASTVEVYGWYPARYSGKDAFRMGNNGVLAYFAGNLSLEFLSPLLHSKRDSILTRLHLDNRHLAPELSAGPEN
jgi:hypothetical protein